MCDIISPFVALTINRNQVLKFGVVIAVFFAFVFLVPKPDSVKPEGWRLTGIFISTIVGLILQPIPGAALVLVAITCSMLFGGLTVASALSGYSDASVWLVVAAFMISRALINSGLARRIALLFVRLFGHNSLGVSYALAFSDVALAGVIPSNGARSGGVILPIVRSIAELYGSKPGATAGVIGTFLFVSVYQCICISTAMFFTGQASNPIAANLATQAGFPITWKSWFLAGIVPGMVSILIVPIVVRYFLPPGVHKTPEAAAFAAKELRDMGRLSTSEWILAVVFVGVCYGWVTSGTHHNIDITVVALIGCSILLVTGVLSWEDVKSEKALWDMFIWYGGLIKLGKALNEAGVAKAFAEGVGNAFSGYGWVTLFVVALLIYFYIHYGFASITAHILAMYVPFLTVLVAKGAPIGLVAFAFATFVNLSAGLTNYGTTPSPMFFAMDYVTMKDWWKAGFIVSLVNLVIWTTVGFGWWRILGIW